MPELQERLEKVRKSRIQHLVSFVPDRSTTKLARWPTKLQKRLEAAGDNRTLTNSAEKRTRWIRELEE